MELTEINRRWGRPATKWVWAARPRYLFAEDGSERDFLTPVSDVRTDDYSDETGWWTCDPRTKIDDLAVIYPSAGKPGEGEDSMMARADAALYAAKDAGRNRAVAAPSPTTDPGDR